MIGSLVIPGKRLGIPGTALVFLGVVTMISWLFVRKFRRHFTLRERVKVFGFCLGWAMLFESFVLLYASSIGMIDLGNAGVVAFTVGVTFLVDALFLWLAFTFSSRRFINWYLEKHGSNAA